MTTILITGATGYLGGLLTEYFLKKEFNIIALALNRQEKFAYTNFKNCRLYCLDETEIGKIFDENNIDIVIHTAVLYGRRNENVTEIIKANEEFPLEVLYEASKHNTKLFINVGTILAKNLNPYSLTKSHFADWLELFADKIKCVNLKIDHFYGANDNHVKFVAWLFEQLKNNVPKIDLTEGSQKREFLYVDDVISAIETVINNESRLEAEKVNVFEAGTGVKTSIKELALIIKEELHNTTTELNFGALPFRKNEMLDYEIDSSGLRFLGWKPQCASVREGIKRIVQIEQEGEG